MRRTLAGAAMMLVGIGLTVGGIASPATAAPEPKVTICHATPPATAKNGWNKITVSANSIIKQAGHDSHAMDIIPPFAYDTNKQYPGKNWDATGRAIWNNGCQAVRPSPSPSRTPKPTPTKPGPQKVTLCHATPPDTAKNGWNKITVGVSAVVGPTGHNHHAMDIIPPFTYTDRTGTHQYPGKNWDATGQAIFANDCMAVAPPTSKPPSPPPTSKPPTSKPPSPPPTSKPPTSKPPVTPTTAPAATTSPSPGAAGMPVTGWPGGLLLAAGVALLLSGGVVLLVGRLRRSTSG